jgi:hypothetical protein
LCDARIGDQRRDKAGAEHDANSVCFVYAAGNGDNLGDSAKLFAGDADHTLAEWWCENLSATAKAGVATGLFHPDDLGDPTLAG